MLTRLPLTSTWSVPDDLARLRAREREAQAVDDVVEPALEEAEHLLARAALAARGVEVVLAELALEDAVDATHLLLLAKADRVLAELDARLAVLPRRVRSAGVGALLGVAALPLQEELHAFAAAKLADGTNVTSHSISLSFADTGAAKTGLRAQALRPGRAQDAATSCAGGIRANQTRRRLGGRQPLWGTGVTSRMSVTLNPDACSARSALSRPAPGPFTNTATERIPCSIALRAASSAASWAANGVLLREPLKPRDPALDHATVLPLTSVIVTTVLLKVDWMWAIPVAMFFLTFFFWAFGLRAPRLARPRTGECSSSYLRHDSWSPTATSSAWGVGLRARAERIALAGALPRASVGVGALAVDGQAAAVTQARGSSRGPSGA